MNRRQFLAGSALSGIALGAADAPHATPKADRPNFLFILLDDLGWGDLGAFGHPVLQTPHMDRLAREGCRLTNMYVTMPICSPSRASCLTGRDPNRFGFKHVVNVGSVNPHVEVPVVHHIPLDEPMLPRQLQQVGYRTGTIGKWHVSLSPTYSSEPTPADYGFDAWFNNIGSQSLYRGPGQWSDSGKTVEVDADTWYPAVYVDQAIRFIEDCGNQPFYLQVWPFSPHVTEEAAEPYRAKYDGRTEHEKTYYGCVTQIDEQLGRLFDYLDSSGLAENTVVILTSDNGPEPPVLQPGHEQARRGSTGGLRGSKHVIYEGGIRVPGIIRWPALSLPGTTSHATVSILDLMPTLCAAAGAPQPGATLDGGDFRPALAGKIVERPHSLFWQCEYSMNTFVPGYTSPPLAMRRGDFKIMCDLEFGNCELYNLAWDMGEAWNLAQTYPDIANQLLAELRSIYVDVNGPASRSRTWINPEVPGADKIPPARE